MIEAKELIKFETVKKSIFQEKLRGGKVKCILCERRCIIDVGGYGYCKTRVNIDGALYTVVYGDLSAIESRPIEIKPFYHYWPGSTATTISTWSCNFNCPWCQNHALSRTPPDPLRAKYTSVEAVLAFADAWGDEGICVSFQEPTLLVDYSIDLFREAVKRGFYCCFVSNGYMSLEALRSLRDSGLTGLKIDIKGGKETYSEYCGGLDVEVVWRNAKAAKDLGIHVELVNLVVTGVNDEEEVIRGMVERVLKELGPETPLHFTRYFPAHRFKNPPTPISVLERAYALAKRMGLYYPYLGNVAGHPYENTYCPNCGKIVIKRFGVRVLKDYLKAGNRCSHCGFEIRIHGSLIRKASWI